MAAGGLRQHELVREEHSCLASGFHREGEPSCGEAASAGYGLDASKSETRTKLPFCGELLPEGSRGLPPFSLRPAPPFGAGWKSGESGEGPRAPPGGVPPFNGSVRDDAKSESPFPAVEARRVCGVQAGRPGFSQVTSHMLPCGREPWG
jgi:hypothetical protein